MEVVFLGLRNGAQKNYLHPVLAPIRAPNRQLIDTPPDNLTDKRERAPFHPISWVPTAR